MNFKCWWTSSNNDPVKKIRFPRSRLFSERIGQFEKIGDNISHIEIQMLDTSGNEEDAEDNGGVFRDTLTHFQKFSALKHFFEIRYDDLKQTDAKVIS